MKLKIYDKDTHDLVYFCNTTGDPKSPDTIEDGGSKAGTMRDEMQKWINSLDNVIVVMLGKGDYVRAASAINLYKETHSIEITELPKRERPKYNPRLDKFCIE